MPTQLPLHDAPPAPRLRGGRVFGAPPAAAAAAPDAPLPLGLVAGVFALAFLLGRCSKRRLAGKGKRSSHVV